MRDKLVEVKRAAAIANFTTGPQNTMVLGGAVDASHEEAAGMHTGAPPLPPEPFVASSTSEDVTVDFPHLSLGTFPLAVASSRVAGRFYVASRAIAAGELVLESDAHIAVVQESLISRVCALCLRKTPSSPLPIWCTECRYVACCSQKCWNSLRATHVKECKALARLREHPPKLDRDAITKLRLVIQEMHWRHHCEKPGEHLTKELYTGLDVMEGTQDWKKVRRTWQGIASAFTKLCSNHGLSEIPSQEIFDFLSAIHMNGFGVWLDGRKQELARVMCVPASLFNHSCVPNLARVQNGRKLRFFALSDVSQGETLNFSYIDPCQTQVRRQLELASWGFTCQCPRCTEPKTAFGANLCDKHLGYLIPDCFGGSWCSTCSTKGNVL